MTAAPASNLPFAYSAQAPDGKSVSGTIDALHLDAAMQQLESMGLRVMEVTPVKSGTSLHPRPLSDQDFLAFNDQLAHLTGAGLPIEQGLRLIAEDLKHGRLAETINAVAQELERGVPIEQAVAKYRDQFPPLYAQLLDAGARSGNLSGLLLSVGKHVETVQRLRAAVWRAIAYPLTVTVGLGIVLLLLSWFVFPQFAVAYHDLGYGIGKRMPMSWDWKANRMLQRPEMELPLVTKALFVFGAVVPWVIVALLGLMIIWPIIWRIARSTGADGAIGDAVLVRLPVVGRALKMNLLARWCGMVRLAAQAGMDLPAGLRLAGETVPSPGLRNDSAALTAALERGDSLDGIATSTQILPPVVPPLLELASRSGDLPAALQTLEEMYQRQADVRIRAIPMLLTPMLMIVLALTIAFVIAGLLMPMLQLVRWLMNGVL